MHTAQLMGQQLANATELESTTPVCVGNRFSVMPPIHSVTCGDNANFTDKFNAYEWTWTLDAPRSMDVFPLGESTATPNTKEGKSVRG